MAVAKGKKEDVKKKSSKEISKEETIIRYGFLTLAVIIGLCLIYFVIASLIPKNYIKIGNHKIAEEEFMYQTNTQYKVFANYYQDYIRNLGFDLSTPEGISAFMKTAYDNQRSFGQMLLEGVVDSIQEQYIMLDQIKETGFKIDEEELEESLAIQLEAIQRAADESGYDLDKYAKLFYGTSFKAMQKVIRQTLRAQQYTTYLEEQNISAVTEERALSYYNSVDAEGNAVRDEIDRFTVVTILKRTVDDQFQPLAEDVIAAAKVKAAEIFEMAKSGGDIYELAKLYSDDLNDQEAEGSEEETDDAAKPGEFTFTKKEVGTTELSKWALKASVGDLDLIETEIGHVIIKLIDRTDYEDMKDDIFKLIASSDFEMKMNEYKDMEQYKVGLYKPYQELYLTYAITQ